MQSIGIGGRRSESGVGDGGTEGRGDVVMLEILVASIGYHDGLWYTHLIIQTKKKPYKSNVWYDNISVN